MKRRFDRNASTTSGLRSRARAAAVAVAALSMHAAALGDGPRGTTPAPLPFEASVEMLPEGIGSASRATCGRTETVDNNETLFVGGSVYVPSGNGGGIWNSAYWTDDGAMIDGPNFLPDIGYGGEVNAVTTITDGTSNTLLFAGTAFDEEGLPRAAFTVEIAGHGWTLPLPTPPGMIGEATGLIAIGPDIHGLIIVVCGKLYDRNGGEHAVYWRSSEERPMEEFSLNFLEGLTPGGDSAAVDVWEHAAQTPGRGSIFIAGYAVDESGLPQAVEWVVENDETHWVGRLASLANAVGSMANAVSEVDASTPKLAFAGNSEMERGRTRPTLWTVELENPVISSVRSLPLGGYRGGQANGIIAILIGLLVPGEVHGPGGSSAALWIAPRSGPAALFNLNLAVDNLPPGLRLTEAVAILPYVEQDNLYKIIVGAGAGGGPHAAIVDVDFGQ